ncbi:Uncharacterised protein [Mycobacteroides abscessus subsp. massiliense]|uniref:hypothetical protein n=1 Tax=Mycobacteroides abscessus TaxID=36809 RepID=UPI000928EEB8|nr:hypothetical protein [Mycobacteroides abscessus]SHX43835.1 Uncharacterised protein [Mycobacteroides abscessus subsp. abscessus]SKM67527.1 Uncharacterised protein [Mycobacteroides abscessus subsp. massiliense]SKN33918.1 Uncharacterised protein [Mycobacteroides abscessus subsp. massiliense]SKP15846.1 Uncharacterised protein [Mycobacteroides abscessus subsp. massiliense]SKP58136.1 Uncharacterised protein [Mycobacteroides abscessus subsp. massiliense]
MSRDDNLRNQYKTYWCRTLQRWPDVQKAQRRVSPATRRTLAAIAIAALVIGGAKIASDQTMPGSGFSTVQTAAADPTGAPGPTGGPGMDGGQQFQPPQMPSSMPEYQGGNQPPMNQDNGISIYQTGAQGAPQQGSQSGGQQQPQQGWDQPAHGTQPPNYSTAPGYTQGPGKPNPDFQAPQQQSPQQGQQPQQPQQQQPSQAPTQTQQPEQPQNKQDDTTQQLDDRQQQCQAVAQSFGNPADEVLNEVVSEIPDVLSSMLPSGGPRRQGEPSRSWSKEPFPVPVPSGGCNGQCPPPEVKAQWGVIRTDYTGGFRSQINSLDDMKRVARDLEDAKSEAAEYCQYLFIGGFAGKVTWPGKLALGALSWACGSYNNTLDNMKTAISRAYEDKMCGTMDFHYNMWFKFTPQRCLF